MWIFDFFKKKAEINIILDNRTLTYSSFVKWKVVINPLDSFTSKWLQISFIYFSHLSISWVDVV